MLHLAVSDSTQSASGSFADVEPGMWHLRVVALDSAGSTRYSGETNVDVQPGQTAQVTLQLEPTTGGGIAIFVTWGSGGPNLLVNGSFEEGPWVGTYLPLDSGSTAIAGWRVSRWQIDLVTFWHAQQGIKSVDLNGNPSLGGIKQTFGTVAGRTYRVRFALAGNPEGQQGIKTVGMSAAGASTHFVFNTSGKTITNMGWVLMSWTFVAVGAETTLEFYSLDPMPTFYGPAIDNVSVQEVE
jgi:choice-of-anchor C domain-containing protein